MSAKFYSHINTDLLPCPIHGFDGPVSENSEMLSLAVAGLRGRPAV